MKAVFVKNIDGFSGEAKLYKLSPYMTTENGTTEYVVVSATIAPFSGPETYIFACDESGKISDWGELDGSYRGGLNHQEALRKSGYSVE